ncbi:hypothetical protein [Bartonella australis]|uniref:hypothetical protein n=1 Tax=Bartonella australis TaxID=388640 RepID=UPI00034C8CC6|nr:hypothetical protein [Bartonella australis]
MRKRAPRFIEQIAENEYLRYTILKLCAKSYTPHLSLSKMAFNNPDEALQVFSA